MPQEVLNILLSCLGVVLTALASWGVTMLTKWLTSKIKDEKARNFVLKITEIVTNAVKQIYQEFVEVLKKEGKFDEAAQKEAKEKALAVINNQLTDELKTYINENKVDLSALIESTLYSLKN